MTGPARFISPQIFILSKFNLLKCLDIYHSRELEEQVHKYVPHPHWVGDKPAKRKQRNNASDYETATRRWCKSVEALPHLDKIFGGSGVHPLTAIYAIELLYLTVEDHAHHIDLRYKAKAAQVRGITWLIRHRSDAKPYLWSTGVVAENWDHVIATAWVLHRLSSTSIDPISGWTNCLNHALNELIYSTIDPKTWNSSTLSQRFRVEARVGAAVTRAQTIKLLSASTVDTARMYFGEWKERAIKWAANLSDTEIDVGTAAFLYETIASKKQTEAIVGKIFQLETTNK